MDWSDYEPVEYGNTSVSELGAHTSRKTAKAAEAADLSKLHEKEPD